MNGLPPPVTTGWLTLPKRDTRPDWHASCHSSSSLYWRVELRTISSPAMWLFLSCALSVTLVPLTALTEKDSSVGRPEPTEIVSPAVRPAVLTVMVVAPAEAP